MTGPQHYAEAERLLDQAEAQTLHGAFQAAGVLLAEAQVHATLAAAAATIDAGGLGNVMYRGQWSTAFVPDEEDQNA